MKSSTLVFFVFITSFFFANDSISQNYQTGIGLRGGWIGGLTAKHFIKEGRAIEGIFSSGWGWRGYQITGLYEIHKAAFTKEDAEGFYWYYGAGVHFGGGYKYKEWVATGTWTGYWKNRNYSSFGIDGIFGLEYKIQDLPITLSLDIKPFIEFSNYPGVPFRFWDGAFSIRYVFGGGDDK